ncbi:hypothetical protein Drorol1_Dr00028268, partial [Drosera rotundifolia]
ALFPSWSFVVARGDRFTGRLWIGWDPAEVTVDVRDRQAQWVHLQSWTVEVHGTPMFCLYRKLRFLKAQLRRLNREEVSDLSERVKRARRDLLRAQDDLLSRVGDPGRGGLERDAAVWFSTLARMVESMLRQKARIRWLELGDRNTAFFFSSVRSRQNRGGVRSLISDDGRAIRCQQELMAEARGYFGSLLSVAPRVAGLRDDQVLPLIRRVIPQDQASVLAVPVLIEEMYMDLEETPFHATSCAGFDGLEDGRWQPDLLMFSSSDSVHPGPSYLASIPWRYVLYCFGMEKAPVHTTTSTLGGSGLAFDLSSSCSSKLSCCLEWHTSSPLFPGSASAETRPEVHTPSQCVSLLYLDGEEQAEDWRA